MALILVVDPDEVFTNFANFVLKSGGHDCLTAANGTEAVALYRSMASRIDLVLTALTMRGMDGVQAILRIRMSRQDAKIICMTEFPEDRPPKGTHVLMKPFSPEALHACVDHALRRTAYAA